MDDTTELLEKNNEPAHNWIDCYRIALDFGPAAAVKAMENMENRWPEIPVQTSG